VDGVSIAAVHAEKDLRAVERAADVVLAGHTHKAEVVRLGKALHLNPGHLSKNTRRGGKASFATLAIEPDELCATIHEVDGSVRAAVNVERGHSGKGTV
jgi:predicted phosphodiesterase